MDLLCLLSAAVISHLKVLRNHISFVTRPSLQATALMNIYSFIYLFGVGGAKGVAARSLIVNKMKRVV